MARIGWRWRSNLAAAGRVQEMHRRMRCRSRVVMPMHLADAEYVVMMVIASFETLLPLDVLENLEIHA
jgi:hypothetical protein